ncbi:MAG: hypothetical protein Q4B88_03545 [Moraxella sp.]|nr:hypothetical protein [Moraxella sp.]
MPFHLMPQLSVHSDEFLPAGNEILKAIDPNRERLKVPLKDNV